MNWYRDNTEVGSYDTPQICLNGHVITSSLEGSPESAAKRCDRCGEETTSKCQNCSTTIRGYHDIPGVISGNRYKPPSYCHECGKAYPWTERKLEAAKEYADLLDELTVADRETLKQDIEDLAHDTPKTQVAAMRFKKTMIKVGSGTANALRDIMVDIMSEAVKKSIWPDK